MFRTYFTNKLLWIGLGLISLLACIFTFAFMGSTVNPIPKELPIGIVLKDNGVQLPNGEELNLGKKFGEQIKNNETSSVEWISFETEKDALEGMKNKEVYGMLILPKDLSKNVYSLLTNTPTKPDINIYINEGMNMTGANVASQITTGVISQFSQQVQDQLFNTIDEIKAPISSDLAKSLANPISVTTEKINPIGENSANGNTPALFTQLLWLTTFFSSMILFTIVNKVTGGKWSLTSISSQLLSGALFVTSISIIILLLTEKLLNVSIPNSSDMLLLMIFTGLCFFFIQNALLNWVGYLAAPLIILLFFFSMPVLTMAPEMLPSITRDWLYSWVPFRFSVEAFRDFLFFKKEIFEEGIGMLGIIGLSSLLVMVLAILKPKKTKGITEKKRKTVVV
ncbi:YhgE/Pip domain-containing protein [Metabacillus litoralis]|uniref:YhgE/Pip domain-containing protein n=1 Tax=Metabacillus litoralis TaxID=152268 RepID=UPI00203B1BB9|nr:ABC transporter permease [Metabacillus litoralis]MCM3412960.1 DUF3533 domain-containing protein [Metabacillus litoralis]